MGLLVAGGAGFLGGHYLRHVVARHGPRAGTLVCLDREPPGSLLRAFPYPALRYVRGDVAEMGALEEARAADTEAIVNFADVGTTVPGPGGRADFLRTNVEGVLQLLEASRRWELPLVHVSRATVYGDVPEGSAREGDPLRPRTLHGASKAAAEHLVRAYHGTYGGPITVVRLGNPFGPHQAVDHLVPRFITAALRGMPLVVYGDGLHARDRLHVEDAVAGVECVRLAGKPGEVYNVGSGRTTAALEVAKAVLEMVRKPLDLITFLDEAPRVARRVSLDTLKIQALGWRPSRPFHEALWETLQWYEAHPTAWKAYG